MTNETVQPYALDASDAYEGAQTYQNLGGERTEPDRIDELIDELIDGLPDPSATETPPVDLRQLQAALEQRLELRQLGAVAARRILARLETTEQYQKDGLEQLLWIAATTENSAELGQYIAQHGLDSWRLAVTAARVGMADLHPYLEQTADRVLAGWPDPALGVDFEQLSDLTMISFAVERRVKSPQDRERIGEVRGGWIKSMAANSLDAGRNKIKAWQAMGDPAVLAIDYAKGLLGFGSEPLEVSQAGLDEFRDGDWLGAARRVLSDRLVERLVERETNPSPLAVPMGLELEVFIRHLLPNKEVTDSWTPDDYADYLVRKLEGFRWTETAGIPKGKDGVWEFAHDPVRHYLTLVRQMQALASLRLLEFDHNDHPLHVTLGEISSEGPGGEGVFVLARAMEATGWSSSAHRLRQPELEESSWRDKGKAGVKERPPDQIKSVGTLPSKSAVEFRVFEVGNLEGLELTLYGMYSLGSALRAHQSMLRGTTDSDNDNERALAAIWADFENRAAELFEKFQMAAPSREMWQHREAPGSNRLGPDFGRLASLLEQAEADSESEGARFQYQIRSLVMQAGSRAMAILDRTRRTDGAGPD